MFLSERQWHLGENSDGSALQISGSNLIIIGILESFVGSNLFLAYFVVLVNVYLLFKRLINTLYLSFVGFPFE